MSAYQLFKFFHRYRDLTQISPEGKARNEVERRHDVAISLMTCWVALVAVVVSLSWPRPSDYSSAHCMSSGVGDSVPALLDTCLGQRSYQGACCAGGLCHSRLQIFSSNVFSQSGV